MEIMIAFKIRLQRHLTDVTAGILIPEYRIPNTEIDYKDEYFLK